MPDDMTIDADRAQTTACRWWWRWFCRSPREPIYHGAASCAGRCSLTDQKSTTEPDAEKLLDEIFKLDAQYQGGIIKTGSRTEFYRLQLLRRHLAGILGRTPHTMTAEQKETTLTERRL